MSAPHSATIHVPAARPTAVQDAGTTGFTLRTEAYQDEHATPTPCAPCDPPDTWAFIIGG